MSEEVEANHLATTWAEVDLGRLAANARAIQRLAGKARVIAVIKGGAYGHGAVPVARTLLKQGIDRFAVATLPEGIELREAGIESPVLVLGAPLERALSAYAKYGLDVTVPSQSVAAELARLARAGHRFRVHVKADTGMHRLGMPPSEATAVVRELADVPNVNVLSLWSHLATGTEGADTFALEQLTRLRAAWNVVKDLGLSLHVGHTGALLHGLDTIAPPERTLFRVGIGLYGYSPSPDVDVPVSIKPVMRLVSRVTHVATIAPGEAVSYGCTWRADAPARMATIGGGYGDGVPCALSNTGTVGIGGELYPIAGRVCMDMTMVHLGSPDDARDVKPGDTAVFFGAEGPSGNDVAAAAGTSIYELLCRVGARVPRMYSSR